MTPRRAVWVLVGISALLRLGWSASLGLGNDEAYHYLFLKHPAWSYFDHPPMLAVVEQLSVRLVGGAVSPFGLRLGFVLLFAGSTLIMARLTERLHGPMAGFLAAFALNITPYHSVAAGTFVLPDGPLLFFWLLTLDRLIVALSGDPRKRLIRGWLWVGLAWGAALLSKYHAVFLPAGAFLYCLVEPSARGWLKRPGPYLAVACGILCFSPVIWWNATHDWASFLFQGGRAVGARTFRPDALASALLGQMCYLFPWIWYSLIQILFKRSRQGHPLDRFLICQSVVPLATFLIVACQRTVLPHWTLVAFLSLFPLLGQKWSVEPARLRVRLVLMPALLLITAALVLAQTKTGFLQRGGAGTLGLIQVSRDPTLDLYGWDQVGRELHRRGLLDDPKTFLFTSSWYHSGHVAFATRTNPVPVLCYNARDPRSFAFWSKPEDWLGYDGILVSVNHRSTEPHVYDRYFTQIDSIGQFEVERAGAPVRKITLYRCSQQIQPFPFDVYRAQTERITSSPDARPGDSASPTLNGLERPT